MTSVHQESMINLYHNRSSELCHNNVILSYSYIFCYRCNIEREIDRFVTEIQWSLDAPGGCLWYNA